MLLVGCAHGVEDPISEPEIEVNQKIPTPRPPAPPVEDAEPSASNSKVYSEWIGNCLVTKVYCDRKLKDLDVMCKSGELEMPWKWLPDPPPYDRHQK